MFATITVSLLGGAYFLWPTVSQEPCDVMGGGAFFVRGSECEIKHRQLLVQMMLVAVPSLWTIGGGGLAAIHSVATTVWVLLRVAPSVALQGSSSWACEAWRRVLWVHFCAAVGWVVLAGGAYGSGRLACALIRGVAPLLR